MRASISAATIPPRHSSLPSHSGWEQSPGLSRYRPRNYSQADSFADTVKTVASTVASYALRPAAAAEAGLEQHNVPLPAAALVVLNTVVGGGISLIATPYAVRELGLVTFFAAQSIFAVLTGMSLHLLAVVCNDLGVYSFQDLLVSTIGGWAGKLTSASIALNNIGILIAFLQTGFDIAETFLGSGMWARVALAGCVVVVAPASALPHVDRLAALASVCALLCVVFVGILVANWVKASAEHQTTSDWRYSVGAVDVLFSKGIPAINLSWTCQFNAVPLFGSLAERNVKTMDKVSLCGALCAMALYCGFGVSVYMFYGGSINDDVMKNIDPSRGGAGLAFPDWVAMFTEGVLGASVLLTVPLFLIEARNMLHHLAFRLEASAKLRWIETVVLLAACYGIAVGVSDLALVLALVGCIPANIIAWLLPGLAMLGWLRRRGHPGASGSDSAATSPAASPTSEDCLLHTSVPPLPAVLASPDRALSSLEGSPRSAATPPPPDRSRVGLWMVMAYLCIGFFVVMLPLGIVSVFR